MEIITAKTAGFCFGVKRAVDMVYEQLDNKPVYTYGPIIHNESVVADLEAKGVKVLDSLDDIIDAEKGTVVIRAHGAKSEIYEGIFENGHELVDATCPFVLKIHNIVKDAVLKNEHVIIVGDCNHPEVLGIESCAKDHCTVIADESEAEFFMKNNENRRKKLCIVSQTTYNFNKFQDLVEIFRKNSYDRIDVLNTICNATEVRQTEAREISQKSDVMFVIGGRNSSNTQKLYDICSKCCENTFYIQTAADISDDMLEGAKVVGITAGASTPNIIIEEVQTRCQI